MADEENTPKASVEQVIGFRGRGLRYGVQGRQHQDLDHNPSIWRWRRIPTFSMIPDGMMRGVWGCMALFEGMWSGHIWWGCSFQENFNRMSKQQYGLWKEVSQKIFEDQCKEVWEYIWGGPREFDCGHMLMWLCQMVYGEVILDVEIDWSTIPCSRENLTGACWSRVVTISMVG